MKRSGSLTAVCDSGNKVKQVGAFSDNIWKRSINLNAGILLDICVKCSDYD